jgi:hypothetical protein
LPSPAQINDCAVALPIWRAISKGAELMKLLVSFSRKPNLITRSSDHRLNHASFIAYGEKITTHIRKNWDPDSIDLTGYQPMASIAFLHPEHEQC